MLYVGLLQVPNRSLKEEMRVFPVLEQRRNVVHQPASDVGKVFAAAFNRCNHIGLGHKIVDERLARESNHVLIPLLTDETKSLACNLISIEGHRCTWRGWIPLEKYMCTPCLKSRVLLHTPRKIVVVDDQPRGREQYSARFSQKLLAPDPMKDGGQRHQIEGRVQRGQLFGWCDEIRDLRICRRQCDHLRRNIDAYNVGGYLLQSDGRQPRPTPYIQGPGNGLSER